MIHPCRLTNILPVHRTCCETPNTGHQRTPLSPTHVASLQPAESKGETKENQSQFAQTINIYMQPLSRVFPLVHRPCSYEGCVLSSLLNQHKGVAWSNTSIHQDPNSIKVLHVFSPCYVRAVHHLIANSRFPSHFTFNALAKEESEH